MARRTGWQASKWPRPASRPVPTEPQPSPAEQHIATLTAQVAAGTELTAYIDAVISAVNNNGLTAQHGLDLIVTKRAAYAHTCSYAAGKRVDR